MTTIHVHAGGRPEVVLRGAHGYGYRFRDAGSLRSKYEDLVARMLRARRDLLARTGDAAFLDDLEGHAFHGNQHTGGISGPHKPKPTGHSQKSAKAAVHELLSSGHPFSKQELMDIAGVKTEKLFADYMAMLKHPKYAGPKGALGIQKNADGNYFVAMPDGTPAPPDPVVAAPPPIPAAAVVPAMAHNPANIVPDDGGEPLELEPGMPGYQAPVPPPKLTEAQVGALSASEHAQELMKAHPGSMTKGAADAHYESAIGAAYGDLKEDLKAGGIGQEAALVKFKTQKAGAMAAWAQAVHGVPFSVKPQQVFKADHQLAASAAAGTGWKAAMVKWKHDTKAEKQGALGTPPPPAQTAATHHAPAPAAAPVPALGAPAPVAPFDYHDLAPHGATDIGQDDITAGRFSKGILALRTTLAEESAASAQQNKMSVEHKLRERLKNSPNFQALSQRLGLAKEGHGSLEARLIGQWASSSGDHHDLSVSLQVAARDAFGIPDSHIEKAALGALGVHGGDEEKMVASGIHGLNANMKKLEPHEVPMAKAALQEFVRAQYDETQEFLKSKGHDHLYLARGMKHVKTNHHAAMGPASLKLQPASSFSANYATAASSIFASNGTVFLVKVPRQQVLSTYMTGFGCTGEHEVVVLAHEKLRAYSVPRDKANTAKSGQEYLHNQLKQHAAATGIPLPKAKPAKKPAAKKTTVSVSKQTGQTKTIYVP